MPTTEQLRSRLLKKLSELFQLDQPDLDFGFYRIMHAKAQEVQEFISRDLLKIVADAFGAIDENRKAELKAKIEQEILAAKDYGVADPENSPKVKEAKAAYAAIKDTASAEADVYDHLYRFFERYYDDGDFISRRYYTRETAGKAAPFAVPYNGEEVKLHWANADQYYIKSAEYFSNFTFDLTQAAEVRNMSPEERALNQIPDEPCKVHFRVVDASEGEHANVKASDANKRFFILHKDNQIALTESGELIVNFEYRPDPEKTGQEGAWRDKRNAEAVETLLADLHDLSKENQHFKKYLHLFKVPAPTDKDKKRPVLAKYVNQYTARNTMDYFIHKDLGGFLRRELDFYIKNEVMHLDDIENADVPAVESYLTKIKVLRKIAGKLIDFLAQLEDFQKKLWLKKKFVVDTNYCITLDRVPDELYEEIAANAEQCEEWVKLFSIDEIEKDLHNPGFSQPLSVDFLKANDKLVLDTRFFNEIFKSKLIASIENFDEQCDGLLIHSENFQALNLLQSRYSEQVKCIYIDPPYNTDGDGFLYKDSYQHSSWIAAIVDRVRALSNFRYSASCLWISIDSREQAHLRKVLDDTLGWAAFIADIAVVNNWKGRQDKAHIATAHENLFLYAANDFDSFGFPLSEEKIADYKLADSNGLKYSLRDLRKRGGADTRAKRPNMFFPIYWDQQTQKASLKKRSDLDVEVYPFKSDGTEGCWRWGRDAVQKNIDIIEAAPVNGGERWNCSYRIYIENDGSLRTSKPKSTWIGSRYSSDRGIKELRSLLPATNFTSPKSPLFINDILTHSTCDDDSILDYFAGSGTTGHAVINLNREDGGNRKYILVEMGDYFDTVLKPRIAKVAYSERWKDGKPIARHTAISHCCKYNRLESYEDVLNNLRLDYNPKFKKAVSSNPALKEDYMLRYFLDVETRSSHSLLNIDAFADPTAYTLNVKKPGTDEYVSRAVDLIETFNYLIGLRVQHTAVPQNFKAEFKRIADSELPEDQQTKLVVDGRIQQNESGPWWFRKVEGWIPKDQSNPNNGQKERVLIVWRKLTGDIEQDNLMLDEWFQKNRISTRDFEFDIIYVNGSNNLPNLKQDDENWKVRLIEEEFMKRMWEVTV